MAASPGFLVGDHERPVATNVLEKNTNKQLQAAVASAQEFLTQVYPGVDDLRLEEVEAEPEGQTGLLAITLSFLDATPRPDTSLASAFGLGSRRVFKRFEVDQRSGRIRSMKIRQVS